MGVLHPAVPDGDDDRTVQLWNLPRNELRQTLKGQAEAPITALAFSSDGQTLATAGFSHLLVFPCIALILTVLSFILLGDKLRDALDPKGR